jgi:hypothetical protein
MLKHSRILSALLAFVQLALHQQSASQEIRVYEYDIPIKSKQTRVGGFLMQGKCVRSSHLDIAHYFDTVTLGGIELTEQLLVTLSNMQNPSDANPPLLFSLLKSKETELPSHRINSKCSIYTETMRTRIATNSIESKSLPLDIYVFPSFELEYMKLGQPNSVYIPLKEFLDNNIYSQCLNKGYKDNEYINDDFKDDKTELFFLQRALAMVRQIRINDETLCHVEASQQTIFLLILSTEPIKLFAIKCSPEFFANLALLED